MTTIIPSATTAPSSASTETSCPLDAFMVWAWVCDGCDLASRPELDGDAIVLLARVHNQLHHGGWAIARPVSIPGQCESCHHAPAAVALVLGHGVTPFAVCSSCAPAGEES